MREWLTAKELAAAALPDLPRSIQGLLNYADREHWQSRDREGRGGGREYHYTSLPLAARVELIRRASETATVNKSTSQPEPALCQLPDAVEIPALIVTAAQKAARAETSAVALAVKGNARARMEAGEEIVAAFKSFSRLQPPHASLTARAQFFVADYNRGAIDISAATRSIRPRLSDRTMIRLVERFEAGGSARLAGNYGTRRGHTLMDSVEQFRTFALAWLGRYPHAKAATLRAIMSRQFPDQQLPSERRLNEWLKRWKHDNAAVFAAIHDPDGWRNKYMTAFGNRSEGVLRINQRWELDSTPADVMLLDGRHTIVGCIDVFTRSVMLVVTPTPTGASVTSCLRRSIVEYGLPETIKTDNGSDYKSKRVERACANLGIEQIFCTPFCPDQKPHIERFFKTFSHGLFELLPGYIGHDVAERKQIEGRLSFARRLGGDEPVEIRLTAADLQRFCDLWRTEIYDHAVHGETHRTPLEAREAMAADVRRCQSERALDLLLAPPADGDGARVIQKKGISVGGRWYVHADLAVHVGQPVLVLLDPADMGRVFVFDENMRYLATAECPEITGIDRQQVAVVARLMQKKHTAELRRMMRQDTSRVDTNAALAQLIDLRTEAERANNVTLLPPPRVVRAASDTSCEQDEKEARYRRACELHDHLDAGEALAPDDAEWLEIYETTPEYRVQRMMDSDVPRVAYPPAC